MELRAPIAVYRTEMPLPPPRYEGISQLAYLVKCDCGRDVLTKTRCTVQYTYVTILDHCYECSAVSSD